MLVLRDLRNYLILMRVVAMDFTESFYHEAINGMIHIQRRVSCYSGPRFEVTLTWPDGKTTSFVASSDLECVSLVQSKCAEVDHLSSSAS